MTLTLEAAMVLLARINHQAEAAWYMLSPSSDYNEGDTQYAWQVYDCWPKEFECVAFGKTPAAAIRAAADRLGVEYQDLLTESQA